jgi:XTP/dITP diphosphohydrolase
VSAPLFELLLASHNRGKLAELRTLLGDLPIELVPLGTALPRKPQATEDGETFLDNARIKARAAAAATRMVTLAEDAGLEVDALGGRPGVRSARFAGEEATDAENNAALLKVLEEVEDDQRSARFRCVMVLIDPWREAEGAAQMGGGAGAPLDGGPESGWREIVAEGSCEGTIARAARGGGGFGYDPLFVLRGVAGPDGESPTMAELGEDEKNRISHRARAIAALRPAIEDLIARRLAAVSRIVGI